MMVTAYGGAEFLTAISICERELIRARTGAPPASD
jgi:hypothetical protein